MIKKEKMLKKILISSIIAFLLFFSTSFCFATTEEMNKGGNDLGSELKDSMNKTEKSASNMIDKVGNVVNYEKNMVTDMVDGASNTVKDTTVGEYNTVRTAVTNENETTNSTTWVWIIMAVAGVLILMAIWFFAIQTKE